MPINPDLPLDDISAEKQDLRDNLQAAKDGIEGVGGIVTSGSPFTINATSFGDSMDYWLPWNAATTASVTLATGVAVRKTFHCTRLGAGNVSVAATNVVSGAIATTTLYDSLVFRSLGNNTWVRVQTA